MTHIPQCLETSGVYWRIIVRKWTPFRFNTACATTRGDSFSRFPKIRLYACVLSTSHSYLVSLLRSFSLSLSLSLSVSRRPLSRFDNSNHTQINFHISEYLLILWINRIVNIFLANFVFVNSKDPSREDFFLFTVFSPRKLNFHG